MDAQLGDLWTVEDYRNGVLDLLGMRNSSSQDFLKKIVIFY